MNCRRFNRSPRASAPETRPAASWAFNLEIGWEEGNNLRRTARSEPGQSRRLGDVRATSVLHLSADLHREFRQVSKVPTGDIARALLWPIF